MITHVINLFEKLSSSALITEEHIFFVSFVAQWLEIFFCLLFSVPLLVVLGNR